MRTITIQGKTTVRFDEPYLIRKAKRWAVVALRRGDVRLRVGGGVCEVELPDTIVARIDPATGDMHLRSLEEGEALPELGEGLPCA